MTAFARFFQFRSQYTLWCGVERERFITDGNGVVLPRSKEILDWMARTDGRFGYELSACQLEDRVGPCRIEEVLSELNQNECVIAEAERALGFKAMHIEVAPDTMPLDVYPDPRYLQISATKTRRELLAACQITGTHIHIGMTDAEAALRVYNNVISHLDELWHAGDLSSGRRLEIYKIMAPNWRPASYQTWEDFERYAVQAGFAGNPRDCWHLIRISAKGTIEFRLFGVTGNLDLVCAWAELCRDLCGRYL